jgi:hypothetical protein
MSGNFTSNAVKWRCLVVEADLGLFANRGATLNLLMNPGPLFSFHILEIWKPEFVLPRTIVSIVSVMIWPP